MTHGINIPFSYRVVRDLILSRINKGAGTPLIIVISRSFLFSELNRLCPMVSWQSQTCPKEIAKVQKAKVRPAKTRQKNQDFRRNCTNNDWHTHKVKSQPIEFQPIGFFLSNSYRLDFITVYYRNIDNSYLFIRHLQNS